MKDTIILMKASALFMTVSKRLFESCALGISLHMAVGLGFISYPKSDRIHVNRHPFCLLFYSISPELITGLEPKIPSSVLYSKHLINRQTDSGPWVALLLEDDAQWSPSGRKEFMQATKVLSTLGALRDSLGRCK